MTRNIWACFLKYLHKIVKLYEFSILLTRFIKGIIFELPSPFLPWPRFLYTVKTLKIFTTSWRRLIYNVLSTSDLRRLEDVQFTTSWRRLICDVLMTSDLQRLADVRFTSSWRRPIYDVLKTSVNRRLCSNVVVTSIQRHKKYFFLVLYSLKHSKKFKCSCLG